MDIIKRLNNDEMAVDAIDDAIAEITALRAALDQERAKAEKLLRMARHDYECMADAGTYNDGPWPCTCGLSALLSGRGEGASHADA